MMYGGFMRFEIIVFGEAAGFCCHVIIDAIIAIPMPVMIREGGMM
jgi:hypothetical protein